MPGEEVSCDVSHFVQLAKPEVVFSGNDVALFLRDGGYQSICGEEGVGVTADDQLGPGNRLPVLAGDAGNYRGYSYEWNAVRGVRGESDYHFGAEGVAGEGDVLGADAMGGGEESDGGFQVVQLAAAVVVGAFA